MQDSESESGGRPQRSNDKECIDIAPRNDQVNKYPKNHELAHVQKLSTCPLSQRAKVQNKTHKRKSTKTGDASLGDEVGDPPAKFGDLITADHITMGSEKDRSHLHRWECGELAATSRVLGAARHLHTASTPTIWCGRTSTPPNPTGDQVSIATIGFVPCFWNDESQAYCALRNISVEIANKMTPYHLWVSIVGHNCSLWHSHRIQDILVARGEQHQAGFADDHWRDCRNISFPFRRKAGRRLLRAWQRGFAIDEGSFVVFMFTECE